MPFGRGRHWAAASNGTMDRSSAAGQVGLVSRLQSGTPVNLGNVRLVAWSVKDVQSMFKLRFDDAGKQVYMLPDDVVQHHQRVQRQRDVATGIRCGATGRYFAPANGPDCIELTWTANAGGFGDCGIQSLRDQRPIFQQHDIRIRQADDRRRSYEPGDRGVSC
jgi:hypothetical protein